MKKRKKKNKIKEMFNTYNKWQHSIEPFIKIIEKYLDFDYWDYSDEEFKSEFINNNSEFIDNINNNNHTQFFNAFSRVVAKMIANSIYENLANNYEVPLSKLKAALNDNFGYGDDYIENIIRKNRGNINKKDLFNELTEFYKQQNKANGAEGAEAKAKSIAEVEAKTIFKYLTN